MYDELFEAWRKEKENVEIQPLPKDFYVRLTEYVKKIREEKRMLDEKTVKGRLLQKEEENVARMVKDLVQGRYEKVTRTVVNEEPVPTTALAEDEEALYTEALSRTDAYKAFLKGILQGRLTKERRERPRGFRVVRILKEIPQIVGADMKTYGPFKPEDIATLPEENAKALIKQAIATEIETK
jgi:DNA replication factor GINS